MEQYLPYALVTVGAIEGYTMVNRFGNPAHAGLGAAIGAHFYILSKDTWIRSYGVMGSYVWLALILLMLRGLAWW
jgi:hypothetical protein